MNTCVRRKDMLDSIDAKVIELMAECDMNVSKVAEIMFFNRTSVEARINRIKRITKLDPRRFYDLIQLIGVITWNGEYTSNA